MDSNRRRYKNVNGIVLPGVTTILEQELGWSKRILINWANRLGLDGVDCNKYTDDKAAIGTLAHQFILDDFRQLKTDTSDYTQKQISSAENSMLSYLEWKKGMLLEPILLEQPLISECHKFGGTPDFYGKVNGKLTLLDFKSGKGIYSEHSLQTCAYQLLLQENNYETEQIIILNIPRSEDESFAVKIVTHWDICQKIFLNCLENYKLKKIIKGND